MDAFRLYAHHTNPTQTYHPTRVTHFTTSMSSITLADLNYITREDLSKTLLESDSAPALPSNLAIVDVRDSDHIGGHIRGSTWVPSSELDYRTPELVRTLKDKEVVVFHCVLSQQRGPSAALRYIREKARLEGESEKEVKEGGEEKGEGAEKKAQKVVVLEGGFGKWQEEYGPDKRLTEAWKKDIWEFGY
ncbi:Rhodanese-like protein [Massarina eburnea CBS 473.64]|uniref:Rhodanese-like protein n=1 Tax=Massarina eburnea CBS 473.64 TaxID=1395130 RepID=A0A6A6RNI2_9PLEO|nr:Rhodanese-like protein [Massarina eburnea CBS 473.64]